MKVKTWFQPLGVLAVVTGLFLLARWVVIPAIFSPGQRSAFESQSPTGKGSAISVLTQYWDGPRVKLLVRDLGANDGDPIVIAVLPESYEFEFLVWSRDGSIVAASVPTALTYPPRKFSPGTDPIGLAYDFNTRCTLVAPSKGVWNKSTGRFDTPSKEEQDAFIRKAITDHGGMGQIIENMTRRPITRWEAYQYGP